jgi:hypothetical protein
LVLQAGQLVLLVLMEFMQGKNEVLLLMMI